MRRAAIGLLLLGTLAAARPAFALFDDEEARRRIEVLRQEMSEKSTQPTSRALSA